MQKFAPTVDRLERRDLQAVVSLDHGTLSCFSDPSVGMTYVEVSYSPLDDNQFVVFSGEDTYFFNIEDVKRIKFYSSSEGGDFFNNATNVISFGYLTGVDNVFVGGSSHDVVFDHALNSFVDDNGGGVTVIDLA